MEWQTADEAVELARRIGFPVAVKLASHVIVHKTEMGGIMLNLTDETAVRQAFRPSVSALPSARMCKPWKACWSNPW